jgi:hypothetical protein
MKKLLFSILLLLALLINCVPGGPGIIPGPAINYFNTEPSSIMAGEPAKLIWNVSGATVVNIDQGIGNVALTGERTITPGITTIYVLTATNSVGVTASATAQIVVSGAPTPAPLELPVINSFIANPPSIPAGGTSTLSWDVSNAASVNISPGVGSFGPVGTAQVTPAADTNYTLTANNATGLSSKTIAVTVAGPVVVLVPDLVITTGSPTVNPSAVAAGGNVTLSGWTVRNQGTGNSGPFSNGFYLSVDPVITAADIYITGNSNNSLTPGSQFSWGDSALTIPASVPPGFYYIGIIVDRTNAVAESNENNNYVSRSISIAEPVILVLPDLVITTGSPTVNPLAVAAGGNIKLSAWTVKNQGTAGSGSFSNGFYLSTNSTITADDTYITGNSNTNLAPGAQFNWGGPTLKIPASTPPGNYYIGILVDRTGTVFESNENNNYVSRLITVN